MTMHHQSEYFVMIHSIICSWSLGTCMHLIFLKLLSNSIKENLRRQRENKSIKQNTVEITPLILSINVREKKRWGFLHVLQYL